VIRIRYCIELVFEFAISMHRALGNSFFSVSAGCYACGRTSLQPCRGYRQQRLKHPITFFSKPSRSYAKILVACSLTVSFCPPLFPPPAHLSQLSWSSYGFPCHVRVLCLPMLVSSLSFFLASLSFAVVSLSL
jgi:hypothetical protein